MPHACPCPALLGALLRAQARIFVHEGASDVYEIAAAAIAKAFASKLDTEPMPLPAHIPGLLPALAQLLEIVNELALAPPAYAQVMRELQMDNQEFDRRLAAAEAAIAKGETP